MLSSLLSAAALLSALQHVDTTVAIRPDGRLVVRNFAGEIVVDTWDRNAVRVRATHSRRERVRVRGSDAAVVVEAHAQHGPTLTVDYHITAPPGVRLDLAGTYSDIAVEGARSDVAAQTVRGDVRVRGGSGVVSATSVEGVVSIEGARGRVSANATNKGIRVADISGQLAAETVNGDVVMEGVLSDDVEAVTTNGNITFDGDIRDRGRYYFATHNGRVTVAVPEGTNATVSVSTYSGQFSSSFPVEVTERRSSRRFSVTLGDGSAQMDLQSFQGAIRLRRPGPPVERDR